jgi:predicted metalloprotease with PDZ domain
MHFKGLKQTYLLIAGTIFFGLNSNAQQYTAEFDLTKVVNDQIAVKVTTPPVEGKNLLYVFPMVVPGTYDQSDYGRFISNFKAFDQNGKAVKVKKNDVNSYKIKKAESVASVSYLVDDTWDDFGKDYIFQPGGTNFQAEKQFSLNNFGLFGYFNGYNTMPYELRITKPTDFYGATSLDRSMTTPSLDVFIAENYVELVDQPILYNVPDTASYLEDGAKIGIAVYSPDKSMSAEKIKELVKPITKAASFVLGNIPTDEYWFLFYFFDFSDEVFLKGGGALGALEHKKSSFYFLPQASEGQMGQAEVEEMIGSIAAHEFLHILSPLNLHSEEIAYFDFYETELSQHLWLYEGVTEYLSIKSRLISDLITIDQFAAEMKEKINQANQYSNVSFTELSKNIIEPKYNKEFGNVYAKGALLAMMLDIKIAQITQGKEDLIDLVLDLIEDYGIKKPFKDDELFDVITRKTAPEIGEFFKDYIIGSELIPYNEILNAAGLEYVTTPGEEVYSFGDLSLEFDAANNLLKVIPQPGNNVLKESISIKSLNGEALSFKLVRDLLLNPENNEPLTIEHVVAGVSKELVLTPQPAIGKDSLNIRKKEVLQSDELVLYNKLFTKGDRH